MTGSDFPSEQDFNAVLKSICANLGIDLHPCTDTFGRTTFAMERDGMIRLRDAARELGYPGRRSEDARQGTGHHRLEARP